MNAKQLIAAVVVFAATGSVFAQTAEFVRPDENFVSSKTRTEVVAELKLAQSQGLTATRDDNYPANAQAMAAPRTRKDVQTETKQAAKSNSAYTNSIYFGS